MKKLLTIVVLALVLCLGLSAAVAASYTAKYNTLYDGDDAAILDPANWTVIINNSEYAIPASANVDYDDIYAADHADYSWVTIAYTTALEDGTIVDVEAHGVAVREANKHTPGTKQYRDEACHLYYLCTECGAKLYMPKATAPKDEFVYDLNDLVTNVANAATFHVYKPVLVDDPTCYNYGEYENRCIYCNALEGEGEGTVITHHRPVRIWDKEPICTNKGIGVIYYWCEHCDKYLGFDAATGLPLDEMTAKVYDTPQKFTPDTDALKAQVKAWYKADYGEILKAAGFEYTDDCHVMDAWVVLYEQSCLHPKTEVRWCVECQQFFETKETGAELEAKYVVQDVACNVAGTTKLTFKCVLCDGKNPAHKKVITVNDALADPIFQNKVNIVHNFVYTNPYKVGHHNPTCTEKGYDDYKCTREAQHTIVGIVAPAPGTIVGQHYNYSRIDIEPLGHQLTEWEMVVAPEEQKNVTGFWRRACTRILTLDDGKTVPCGYVERWFHELPPPSACEEHVPEEYYRDEPTCTETGMSYLMCAVCGIELDPVEIPAAGHDWKQEVIVAATCAEKGVALKTCSVCGKVEKVELAKKEHTWDEGKVTTEPTTEKAGVKTYTCKVCKATKTEEIKKLDKPAEYKLENVKFEGTVLSGKIVHTEGTLEADKLSVRVTFFIAGNTYMTTSAVIYEDGTFEAEGAGNIEHVTLAAYATDKVVNPDGLKDVDFFGSKEFDVK